MTLMHNRLSDRLTYTLEPCPNRYWGPLKDIPADQIQRMTIYVDGQKMMVWDTYLTDSTRFEPYLEVDPAYRNGEWMDLLVESDPGSLDSFSRTNCVWVSSAPIIEEQEQALRQFHATMTERGIMRTTTIFAHGSINKIIPVIQP